MPDKYGDPTDAEIEEWEIERMIEAEEEAAIEQAIEDAAIEASIEAMEEARIEQAIEDQMIEDAEMDELERATT